MGPTPFSGLCLKHGGLLMHTFNTTPQHFIVKGICVLKHINNKT